MSTSGAANPFSIIANQLANPTILTTEQILFKEALKSVEERRKKQQNLPKFFDRLNSTQKIDDVKRLIEDEKAHNLIWKQSLGKSWLKISSDFAGYILNYKDVVGSVASLGHGLVGPVWTTIKFVIDVFKDIGTAIEDLENIEKTLERSLRRFAIYVGRQVQISANLREALVEYYEEVIDFYLDVHQEFAHASITTTARAIHRTLKEKLTKFNGKIHHVIDDVDKGANIDMFANLEQEVKAVKNISVSPTVVTAGPLLPALHMVHGLPQPNRSFTGQQQYLRHLWNLLHGSSMQCQKRVTLYGMGGIGKTQILLRYAYDSFQRNALPRPYDTVIWIDAHSSMSITRSLSDFMEHNGFSERIVDDGQGACYTPFHTRLKQHAKQWLLIFDNVVDPKIVNTAIPPGTDGHIVFSTRERLNASRLSDASDCIKIDPMDRATAVNLVKSLASLSDDPNKHNEDTLNQIADFTQGFPLLIEQLVHNAIFGKQSLVRTLEDARNKEKLSRQNNAASLHETDLSLGALVLQTFELLRAQSGRAEALLKILSYLEPSSIPFSLFSDCIGRVQETMATMSTRKPSASAQRTSRQQDPTAGLKVPHSPRQNVKRHRFSSPFRRSVSRQNTTSNLPLHGTDASSSLQQVFDRSTPLGQLFEDRFTLDTAFEMLVNNGIVSKLNNDKLCIHDRVSEVAQALIASDITAGQNMALAAATMVHIASPTPTGGSLTQTRKVACYLPQMVACHTNLKQLGLLNNCFLGPEISHITASTLDFLGEGSLASSDTGVSVPTQLQAERRAVVTRYYQDAYAGYMAEWGRLRTQHGLDDIQIAQSVRADRDTERNLGRYFIGRYMHDHRKFGQNAAWRAIQTASRLSDWLRRDATQVDLALIYVTAAIKASAVMFGDNDEDTIYLKREKFSLLAAAERWREAYDFNIQSLKEYLGWRPGDERNNEKIVWSDYWQDSEVSRFAQDLGFCCMTLVDQGDLSEENTILMAREAAMWTKITVQHRRWVFGERYDQHDILTRLARANERVGTPRAAIFWYGQAVFCRLSNMIWEREKWTDGPGLGAVPSTNEHWIVAVVANFEEAMTRLFGEGDGKLGNFDDLDTELYTYLCTVKSTIARWRMDREEFGVWDPWKEEEERMQREFDEREEAIRREEEEKYGPIPPLHEAFFDEGEDKENINVVEIQSALTDVQSREHAQDLLKGSEELMTVPTRINV